MQPCNDCNSVRTLSMRDQISPAEQEIFSRTTGAVRSRRQTLQVRQEGITLVELIISIVIIGIAATALLQSLGFLTTGNVDPMLRSQSNLLAQQMLNEVQSQSFFEPDNDPRTDSSATPEVCPGPESSTGYDRQVWDNVCDYVNYDSDNDDGLSGIRNKNGALIDGLDDYQVEISVDDSDSVSLGSMSNDSSACSAPRLLRIDLTVTDPRGQTLQLSGYRASYWDEGC